MAEKPTYISKVVDSASGNGDCDSVCKKVLATKEIAAHILKEVVSEYKNCSIDDIIRYISDVEIGQEPVDVDDIPPAIETGNSEDSTIKEGVRYYDIKFTAAVPDRTKENINLIINIEAQKDYTPGYSLLRRGIYYCARLISSQYNKVFTNSQYDKIRKVYSIWICTNPDDGHKNTIVRYKISPEELFGSVLFKNEEQKQQEKQNYDMLSLVMICLDNYHDGQTSENSIIKLLSVLLSNNIEIRQKKKILEEDCCIRMTKEVEEEVETMCNLSQGYFENGFEKGKQEGKQEGENNKLKELILMWARENKTPDEIAGLLHVPVEDVIPIAEQAYAH